MNRRRPIRNLFFRYIQGTALEGRLDADDAFSALQLEGLVEASEVDRSGWTLKYSETDKMLKVTEANRYVLKILNEYADKKDGGVK